MENEPASKKTGEAGSGEILDSRRYFGDSEFSLHLILTHWTLSQAHMEQSQETTSNNKLQAVDLHKQIKNHGKLHKKWWSHLLMVHVGQVGQYVP